MEKLKRMRKSKIGNSNISFDHILMIKASDFVRNEDVRYLKENSHNLRYEVLDVVWLDLAKSPKTRFSRLCFQCK